MPALEIAQETGRIVRWLKVEGDEVAKGDPLMEIETDKVTVEIEAPADGTLGGVRAAEGDDVPVGEAVAFILAPGESAPEAAAVASAARATAPTEAPSEAPSEASNRLLQAAVSGRPLASPKARRLAAERGVDVGAVAGTGPHGAVLAADLGGEPRRQIGTIWRRMAERTTASWQSVPHFFLTREVDATALVAARERHEGVTHTDLLVRSAAAALREHPRVNATWRDGEIVPAREVNVGIAVAVEDGLIVPVIHGADRLGLDEIATRRAELVAAARDGRLRPEDVSGGTFTISNLGMYGVDAFLAIVNAPQAAILAVGRIAERVIPVNGEPAVRPTLLLTVSFDHRVVDGARGAEFLDTLATLMEDAR